MRIPNIRQPAHINHQPLEPEPKPRMRHRAVTAEIAIPLVMLRIEPELRHALVENIEPFLALRAADDFADAGREHVHRRRFFRRR